MIRKLWNLIVYGKWTGCYPHDWIPEGFADWECSKCGVGR